MNKSGTVYGLHWLHNSNWASLICVMFYNKTIGKAIASNFSMNIELMCCVD